MIKLDGLLEDKVRGNSEDQTTAEVLEELRGNNGEPYLSFSTPQKTWCFSLCFVLWSINVKATIKWKERCKKKPYCYMICWEPGHAYLDVETYKSIFFIYWWANNGGFTDENTEKLSVAELMTQWLKLHHHGGFSELAWMLICLQRSIVCGPRRCNTRIT